MSWTSDRGCHMTGEESPGFTGLGARQRPVEETPRLVQQKETAMYVVRVERRGKSSPLLLVTEQAL